MAVETERKFLVVPGEWEKEPARRMVQGYLSRGAGATVRVRVAGNDAWLTVKGRGDGVSRPEFEYAVPVEDALAMLSMVSGVIAKTRRRIPAGRHFWEVDVFEGENEGLVVAEIELDSADEAFERPVWLGTEVTGKPRYYNSELSVRPYRMWSEAERRGE